MSSDNRLQCESPAFGVRICPSRRKNRRRPGMTESRLVSARTDSRPRSDCSAAGWRSGGRKWKRTPGV